MDDIEIIRAEIDKIDKKLRSLLEQRRKNVEAVGELKKISAKEIRDLHREEKILKKCDHKYEREIFKVILSESRKLQS